MLFPLAMSGGCTTILSHTQPCLKAPSAWTDPANTHSAICCKKSASAANLDTTTPAEFYCQGSGGARELYRQLGRAWRAWDSTGGNELERKEGRWARPTQGRGLLSSHITYGTMTEQVSYELLKNTGRRLSQYIGCEPKTTSLNRQKIRILEWRTAISMIIQFNLLHHLEIIVKS